MNKEVIGLFKKFGLTHYESSALAVLIENNELNASDIGRLAEVPKTRVYDVLEKLGRQNLILKVGTTPKRYKIGNIDEIFERFLEKKEEEIKELEREIKKIKKLISGAGAKGDRILKVRGRNDALEIIKEELGKAKKEVKGFTDISHHKLEKTFKKLNQKNVEIKLISHLNKNALEERYGKYAKIREFPHLGLHAFIVDGKKLVLGLYGENEEEEHGLAIYNESPKMVHNFSKYFDYAWGSKS